eukprot:TRINITY_DN6364_c1_g3_i1.p1 TRINITY_DN6364_c1_g3~~TRINITY_DN6364_c1_g3_i1.p1  ORF type:complete len:351 (+),score=82.20 TRINITY_DN6364_c1_g3_i1:442-1494(+)
MFLDKAIDLGDRLIRAFNSDSGIPYPSINLKTGRGYPTWGAPVTTLAELNVQLEFDRLSLHSGNDTYSQKMSHVIGVMDEMDPVYGLYPLLYNLSSGSPSYHYGTTLSFGGQADSFYEYLLKVWLLGGKTNIQIRKLYDESVDGMIKYCLRRSNPSKSLFVSHYKQGNLSMEMDHLSCFVPGMLMLGAHGNTSQRDISVAKELLITCINMYACSVSGLAPETTKFVAEKDWQMQDPRYMLRPETLESIFIMHRLTNDPGWREHGWKIFEAIRRNCRTPSGYTGIKDVGLIETQGDDIMQGFFMSETMKYLYLLFSSADVIPLEEYVFNTEAHPFKILSSREEECERVIVK